MKKSESTSANNSILKSGRYVFYNTGTARILVSIPEIDENNIYSKRRIIRIDNPKVINPGYAIYGDDTHVAIFVADLTFPKGEAKISRISRCGIVDDEKILKNFNSIIEDMVDEGLVITDELLVRPRTGKPTQFVGKYAGTSRFSANMHNAKFSSYYKVGHEEVLGESTRCGCTKYLVWQGIYSIPIGAKFQFELS